MRIIKIGVIAFAALTLHLQSCQKKGPETNSGRYPILFDCSSYDTKAISTEQDLKDNGFVVRADYSLNGGEFNFLQDVKYNAENQVWAGTPTEYWWPGASYTFNAIYPKLSEQNLSFVDGGIQINNFDVKSQIDILAATVECQVPSGNDAPKEGSVVKLDFKHLLALVVVEIKAEVRVTVNQVTLMMVPIKANYAGGYWNTSSQGNIDKTINMSFAVNESKDVTEGGFLVIPGMVNGYKLRVDTPDKDYDITIPSINWVAGTKYTYKLTIKQNDIMFDEPSVEEWDEENAVGSVIIK